MDTYSLREMGGGRERMHIGMWMAAEAKRGYQMP